MNQFVDIEWAFIEIWYKDGQKLMVVNYPSGKLDCTRFGSDNNVIRTDIITHEILNSIMAVTFPEITRIGLG